MNAFPARISFHPWRNCFGFVVDDHTRPKTLAISQPSNGFPLGSFTVCAYSKSCQPLVIDLYSLASSSLEQFCNGHTWMLLLNEKLAFAAGLSGNDQVGETSSCIYVEIRPQSFRDWETVQSSSTEFELTMLNQIGVVCEGMSFPIWIGQNIVSLFTVVNISPLPPPNSGCVRLAEDTEIYVQPYSDYTKGEITEPIAHRDPGDYSQSGFSSAFSRIISRFLPADDTADHCLVDEFIRNISKDSINVNLRILPRSLLDGDIYGNSTGCCPRPSIVRIQSFDVKNPAFALLFFLPKDSPSDRRIADTLRGRNSHCILSTYLYEFSLTDCAWIDCSAIDSSHVRVVKHLEVLAAQSFGDDLIAGLKAFFSTRCSHYPVVMSASGLRLAIDTNTGSVIECRVRPSKTELINGGSDGKEMCFAFACDHFPRFEVLVSIIDFGVQNDLSIGRNEAEESKEVSVESSAGYSENFGESVTDTVALEHNGSYDGSSCSCKASGNMVIYCRMQSRHIASCARYIEYCLESGRESPGHVLIVGPELSGKSTIALRLAKRLLKSPKTVLSACIECKRWKGRSTENVEKQLARVTRYLKQRRPSILFLENIDFCSSKVDEDQRNLHLERLFAMIWRILARSGVLVIATAKSLHAVHRTLATPQGKRFFARVEEIESLEEVSLDLLEAF
ncbi:unnamed protein product [Toxocara canis]|uniref:Peroxisomal ATPase PEX1 n=1 Tax=Toxocara canis TaxID=6265 RepID=A0A183URM4_TOXCA|nr:unnamed protein product [Toxocara canis]